MSEKQWELFFDLMNKIVNLPGLSADEKKAMVQKHAAENSAEIDLGEFAFYCEE